MSDTGNFALIAHGPIFIGTMINVVLWGISITQTYIYFSSFKKDPLWMKLVVVLITLADAMNSIFDMQYIYHSLVDHYNDPAAIQKANWVFATDPAMTSIIGTITQLFFAWRVHVLTKNRIAVALLFVGSIISCLGGIATSIAIGIVPKWLEFQKFEIPVIVWLTVSALVDTTIAVILVWHLRNNKRGFKKSDDLLDKLIRVTVQTGLITSVWAIIDLGVYLGIASGVHLIFNFPLSKLYSNSLLSSLNSRAGWKFAGADDEESSTGGRRPEVVTFGSTHPLARPEVYINVQSESHELRTPTESKFNTKEMSESSSGELSPTACR
ncbi:uncharacterized protein STEHIDRAFT_168988 [Stereum hirsutum FP-91666 SS1]|uniref:uncharacterized protein n=1 Tax=Stereum hirsutum (strain FP-91666) TaxID=721885 RepID=UPI00044493BA|nr:uncharacterized protein STEHIDRAFT_168988 [Stereum hirsutum FP-91666 SS1]EIM85962.1 hypothetical protein STEHIDRAFT_168988 [Stereum hirsutum FP-91666 SS1]